MQEKIQKHLQELVDKTYQEFHSGLCPGTDNILGVRVPVLRQYAKELIQQGKWREVLEWKRTKYYEERMLQGMLIGLSNITIEETIEYLEKFIPHIDNWAICDVVCAGLKITKRYPRQMWEFITKYINSNKEFEVRFAIVMMLDFYITEDYIYEIWKMINKVKQEDYYVKMSIAWLVSVAYIKFPQITKAYLKENHLDVFTHNKAIQKIIESNRICKQEKEKIRTMKRTKS